MIAVQKELTVRRDIGGVWEFVRDMGNWASQMPGYVSHELVDDNTSVWTLQVNMGPFTRPVVMDVNVLRWTPPGEVEFVLKGRFDPFHGGGMFKATEAEQGTHILLDFTAEATGSMGKVLTAMAIPVLRKVAEQFSGNLAGVLGGAIDDDAPQAGDEALPEESVKRSWAERLRGKRSSTP